MVSVLVSRKIDTGIYVIIDLFYYCDKERVAEFLLCPIANKIFLIKDSYFIIFLNLFI